MILNPQAAGAVRSLLGPSAALPTWMFNHRSTRPKPAQQWHRDGCSRYGHAVNHLQVFYYPQDTPLELGPTEVLPGSHFLFNLGPFMGHYGGIRGTASTAAPEGTIFITAYPIWHRRGASTAEGVRNMLKYLYWRMVPPQRDWIVEPDFSLDDLNRPRKRPLRRQGAPGQRPVPPLARRRPDVLLAGGQEGRFPQLSRHRQLAHGPSRRAGSPGISTPFRRNSYGRPKFQNSALRLPSPLYIYTVRK